MTKLNKIKISAGALALASVVAVGGICAYFTDTDHAPNVFTVGNGVNIKLDEPSWDDDDPNHENIVPNEEFAKDPTIINEGSISAYSFITVSVPYANTKVVAEDGSVSEAEDRELFSYDINDGWVQLGTPIKDTDAKTVTHTYVYGTDTACTPLAGGVSTSTLFDTVKFANIVESDTSSIAGKTLTVDVKGYAIQSDEIADGSTNPAVIWSILSDQVSA